MNRSTRGVAHATLAYLLLTTTVAHGGARTADTEAVALQLAAAFDRHALVAIGENHGMVTQHRVLQALLLDPRLRATIDDIVVEFGNARFQATLDTYIAGGEPDIAIAAVWRETTQMHGVWDSPIYREFFAFVRSLNQSLPASERLRVVAGDYPVDWDGLANQEDLRAAYRERDTAFAETVRREVLARGRKALVLIGGAHLKRGQTGQVAALLEATHPGELYAVLPVLRSEAVDTWGRLQPNVAAPAMAAVAGSAWEHESGHLLFPDAADRSLAEVADALLYLGPRETFEFASPDVTLVEEPGYCDRFRARVDRWMSPGLRGSVQHPCVAAAGR